MIINAILACAGVGKTTVYHRSPGQFWNSRSRSERFWASQLTSILQVLVRHRGRIFAHAETTEDDRPAYFP
jgi:hypothetical protein